MWTATAHRTRIELVLALFSTGIASWAPGASAAGDLGTELLSEDPSAREREPVV
jgi:hypothetical protein